MMSWSPEAKKMAKELGLFLAKFQLQGKHATEGPMAGVNVSMSGTLTPEQAYVVRAVMHVMQLASYDEVGVRELPDRIKEPTARALRKLLALVDDEAEEVETLRARIARLRPVAAELVEASRTIHPYEEWVEVVAKLEDGDVRPEDFQTFDEDPPGPDGCPGAPKCVDDAREDCDGSAHSPDGIIRRLVKHLNGSIDVLVSEAVLDEGDVVGDRAVAEEARRYLAAQGRR